MTWDLDEHATATRDAAERQFKTAAPELLEDFQRLPADPGDVVSSAGNLLATNLGMVAGAMANTLNQTVQNVSTQLLAQAPALGQQVSQQMSNLTVGRRSPVSSGPVVAAPGGTNGVASFTVASPGTAPLTYQWYLGNTTTAVTSAAGPSAAATSGVPPSASSPRAALEFRWVAREDETPTEEVPGPPGTAPLRLLPGAVLRGPDVGSAGVTRWNADSQEVSFFLDPAAVGKFSAATAANVGRRLAVVWQGRVLCAPIIQAPIAGAEFKMAGRFTAEEVNGVLNAVHQRQSAAVHDR